MKFVIAQLVKNEGLRYADNAAELIFTPVTIIKEGISTFTGKRVPSFNARLLTMLCISNLAKVSRSLSRVIIDFSPWRRYFCPACRCCFCLPSSHSLLASAAARDE